MTKLNRCKKKLLCQKDRDCKLFYLELSEVQCSYISKNEYFELQFEVFVKEIVLSKDIPSVIFYNIHDCCFN